MCGKSAGFDQRRTYHRGYAEYNNLLNGCILSQEFSMPFVKAAGVGEVTSGGQGKAVSVAGKNLALFNCNGTFYAVDNECTHRGASLAEGDCAGDQVACPLHGAVFHLPTGQPLSPPARTPVKTYKVQIVGDE